MFVVRGSIVRALFSQRECAVPEVRCKGIQKERHRRETGMSACEACWAEAGRISANSGRSVTDEYMRLMATRISSCPHNPPPEPAKAETPGERVGANRAEAAINLDHLEHDANDYRAHGVITINVSTLDALLLTARRAARALDDLEQIESWAHDFGSAGVAVLRQRISRILRGDRP